jgi:DNA replicative helicase MCM subunit Mcm2 (Cdc46/Mcm family)
MASSSGSESMSPPLSDHVFHIPSAEPSICTVCNGQKTFEIVHNRCIFTDKQMIKLQETPDKVKKTVGFGAGQQGRRKMWTRQS